MTEFERPACGLRKLGMGRSLIEGSRPPVTMPFVGEIISVGCFTVSLMKRKLII